MAARGAGAYFGERVSMTEHGLQAAHFAQVQARPMTSSSRPCCTMWATCSKTVPDAIEDWTQRCAPRGSGARWLAQRFPASKSAEPVRLHVPAKRYLCATDPHYFAQLSPASVHTLKLQGGPMAAQEVARFEQRALVPRSGARAPLGRPGQGGGTCDARAARLRATDRGGRRSQDLTRTISCSRASGVARLTAAHTDTLITVRPVTPARGHRPAQGAHPPGGVPRPVVFRCLHRSGQCRLRRGADAPRSGILRLRLRPRRRHFLHRLLPVRSPEQPDPAPRRRAPLDRAHHDQLGADRRRHGIHSQTPRPSTRCASCSALPRPASSRASSITSLTGFRQRTVRASWVRS